jgi:hypothetical protein
MNAINIRLFLGIHLDHLTANVARIARNCSMTAIVGVSRYDSGLLVHKRETIRSFSEHPPRSRSFGRQGAPDPVPGGEREPEAAAKSQVSSGCHSHAR